MWDLCGIENDECLTGDFRFHIEMKGEENTWEKYICLIVTVTMRTRS